METQLESFLRQRQLALWGKIVRLYGIDNILNVKVHSWISNGVLAENTYPLKRTRRSAL